jgi:hypothetical protein
VVDDAATLHQLIQGRVDPGPIRDPAEARAREREPTLLVLDLLHRAGVARQRSALRVEAVGQEPEFGRHGCRFARERVTTGPGPYVAGEAARDRVDAAERGANPGRSVGASAGEMPDRRNISRARIAHGPLRHPLYPLRHSRTKPPS